MRPIEEIELHKLSSIIPTYNWLSYEDHVYEFDEIKGVVHCDTCDRILKESFHEHCPCNQHPSGSVLHSDSKKKIPYINAIHQGFDDAQKFMEENSITDYVR